MMAMLSDEESKALQEMARAAGKSVEAAQDLGGFIAKYIGGPLEQAVGIWHDKLKYRRWANQIVLTEKATAFLKARGLDGPSRTLDLSLAIPLLEEASLADTDELQTRWASLLANAADANRPRVRRAFVSILADLAPSDASMLEKIFDADRAFTPTIEMPVAELWTHLLPDTLIILGSLEHHQNRPLVEMRPDVEVSLGNLSRLGLIESVMAWGGKTQMSGVSITELGRQFVAACRPE